MGEDQICPTETDIAPGLAQRAITPPGQSARCSRGYSQQPDQIDHMPKCGNKVGATILVIEVVHLLPNIQPEYGNPVLLIYQSNSNRIGLVIIKDLANWG